MHAHGLVAVVDCVFREIKRPSQLRLVNPRRPCTAALQAEAVRRGREPSEESCSRKKRIAHELINIAIRFIESKTMMLSGCRDAASDGDHLQPEPELHEDGALGCSGGSDAAVVCLSVMTGTRSANFGAK
jgi:hypothetical protein